MRHLSVTSWSAGALEVVALFNLEGVCCETEVAKTKRKPSEAGFVWRGGATERRELCPEGEASEAEFAPTTGL